MKRTGSAPSLVARLALLSIGAIVAAPAAALDVTFLRPQPNDGVFGPTDVVVAVTGGTAARVELFYDGARAATLTKPPWKFTVDVGGENVDRRFRVVATGGDGSTGASELFLPKLQVDEVIDLPLRQLYVTATKGEQPVLDLGRGDFRIVDGGDRQNLVTFERGDAPLAALLLIDSSLSMKGEKLRAAIQGARTFAEGMKELDEAMLLLFSDQVVASSPFTDDAAVLVKGLTGAEAGGGSAINDNLYLALQLLEARQGRRVVVLLSDGIDVESLISAADVLEFGRRTSAMVYWIRIAEEPYEMRHRSPWRGLDSHTAEQSNLAELVASSGGRRIDIPSVDEAAAAFTSILTELRQQYVLGYYPRRQKHNGAWREIDLKSAQAGVGLRTRSGYYDD